MLDARSISDLCPPSYRCCYCADLATAVAAAMRSQVAEHDLPEPTLSYLVSKHPVTDQERADMGLAPFTDSFGFNSDGEIEEDGDTDTDTE